MAHVIIDDYSSRCSACGGNADYYESRHFHGGLKSMWDAESSLDKTNGCGVEWDEESVATYGVRLNGG